MKTNRYSIWEIEVGFIKNGYLVHRIIYLTKDNKGEKICAHILANQLVLIDLGYIEITKEKLIGYIDDLEEIESYVKMYELIHK